MLSPELETAIRHALDDATNRGHEFSGLEHLLLALMVDEKTSDVIKHCGGSIVAPHRASWRTSSTRRSSRCPRRIASGPSRRWRSRAWSSARSTTCSAPGKAQANGANVLVAIFAEPESQRGRLPQGGGDQPPRRGQLHLARHLQAAAGQDRRRRGTAADDGDDEADEAPADPLAAVRGQPERARARRARSIR